MTDPAQTTAPDAPLEVSGAGSSTSAELAAELADCRRRLSLVRELSHTVVYVFDLETRTVEWINRHLATSLGYEPDEVQALGSSFLTQLMHPDDLLRMGELLARWTSADDDTILETEYRLLHKNGSWRAFLGRDTIYTRSADGRPRQLLGATVDVTSRREAQRQAARAEKLEAVARMAGGIALDFNNLLTVVLGNVALARTAVNQGADPSPHLDELRRVAEQAASVSRQLLGLSKLEPANPETIDANTFVRANEALLSRLTAATYEAGQPPELVFELNEVWPIRMDPTQLIHVLVALVSNADDAKAKVVLKTDRFRVESSGSGLAPGRWVRFTIADDGPGMPAEVAARAFDAPGYIADGGPQRGLGLATVHGIVRQNHGSLDLWSEVGKGTRIEVCFPALEEVMKPEPARLVPTNPDAGGLVIVAEDEPMVAELTRRILVHAGHRVMLCRDGVEALEAIRKHQDEVALVISDIVMPRLSGLELAKQLALELPDLPLLLASGYPEDERRLNDYTLSQVAFLPKPFRAADLLQAVSQLLAHHARTSLGPRTQFNA